MLLAMAGLPASGKSSLANRLAEELGGVVLSKDRVRAALFPGSVLDYSDAENDITMGAIFAATRYIRATFPRHAVILDGRTFLQSKQINDLIALAASLGEPAHIIECVCADAVARQRLDKDIVVGTHPAKNRTYALYLAKKECAEPIRLPHLVLDTAATSEDECIRRCLDYLEVSTPTPASF